MGEQQLENMFSELKGQRDTDPIIVEHARFHFFAGAAAILKCIGDLGGRTPEQFADGMASLMTQVNNNVLDIVGAAGEAQQ